MMRFAACSSSQSGAAASREVHCPTTLPRQLGGLFVPIDGLVGRDDGIGPAVVDNHLATRRTQGLMPGLRALALRTGN